MKKYIFILLSCILLFTFCSKNKKNTNVESFFVRLDLRDDSRSEKDYVKLWIDDSLYFSGPYFSDYSDDFGNVNWSLELAKFDKPPKDSLKFKISIISLDTVLFSGRKVVDTMFYYNIQKIPGISIFRPRRLNYFSIYDIINCPNYWIIE